MFDLIPRHYPFRGWMVDLEMKKHGPNANLAIVHKERWFKTEAEAVACVELFRWAVEGCTRRQLAQLAREHNGRMT